jgi:hypothetical protein
LSGRGAADSARGATMAHGETLANHGAHVSSMHAATEHEHATSKLAGTDHHHHHPGRREPGYGITFPQFFESCNRVPDPFNPWLNCYGPTKSSALKGHS